MDTRQLSFFLVIFSLLSGSAFAESYAVTKQKISDPKVVFATVESTDVVAARSRINGTIITLNVKEGDFVKAGQDIAVVGDEKLALQAKTLEAQITGLSSQAEKANADLKRVEGLLDSGAVAKSTFDGAKAAASSADNDLKARRAQRALIAQQVTEGKILAPSDGRVLSVPLTSGSVIMAGETVATIAADSYVLRLSIPERHASFLQKGDKVRLDNGDMTSQKGREGEISLVYPAIENGRVTADVTVEGLSNYFVGERIRVWITTAQRDGFVIPHAYLKTQSGVDYVRIQDKSGKIYEIPVQTGHSAEDKIEILSGLKDGDVLLTP